MLQWSVGGVLISRTLAFEPEVDRWVCDAWPVRRQTYGYLTLRTYMYIFTDLLNKLLLTYFLTDLLPHYTYLLT